MPAENPVPPDARRPAAGSAARQTWQVGYPNPTDFNFDYRRLLDETKHSGLGKLARSDLRVAVVGAGIAGLTAARELFRCGCRNIHIYEAAGRLGGRLYSRSVKGQHTAFELGAMRPSLFEQDGRGVSALGHYTEIYGVTTQLFPATTRAKTGIFVNEAFGPDSQRPFAKPKMLLWNSGEASPPDPTLAEMQGKFLHFVGLMTSVVAKLYGTEAWRDFWRSVVERYWTVSFRGLLHLAPVPAYDPRRPGDFGGLGLNDMEARLFRSIGMGDGGWGPLLESSSLHLIRVLLSGYADQGRLFQGRFAPDGHHAGGPHQGDRVVDSLGNPLSAPAYLGTQSVAEGMFFMPVESNHVEPTSLYDAMKSDRFDVRLFTGAPVHRIERLADGSIDVAAASQAGNYEAVVLTTSTLATELGERFIGFPKHALPPFVVDSMRETYWLNGCKVFVALNRRYWEVSEIPQLIMTDTFVKKLYGYAVQTPTVADPGVVVLSYTWGADADKFLAETDAEELVSKCITEVDRLLARGGLPDRLSRYVDRTQSAVIQWSKEPTFRGCATSYHERNWAEVQSLATYNQRYSALSGLYFAGEAFSPDGGWVEPAIRTGIDAVMHVLHNFGGKFSNGFSFERDFPKHDTDWTPRVLP